MLQSMSYFAMEFHSARLEIKYGHAFEETVQGPIPDFVGIRLPPGHSYISINERGHGKLKLGSAHPDAPIEVVAIVYPFSEDVRSLTGSIQLQREEELRMRPQELDRSLILAPFVSPIKKPVDENSPVGFPVREEASVYVYHVIHGVGIYRAQDIAGDFLAKFQDIAENVLARLVMWHREYAAWRCSSQLQVQA